MHKQKIYSLGILMIVVIVSDSSVINRRSLPSSSGEGELRTDKKLGYGVGVWGPENFKTEEYDTEIGSKDDDIANTIFTGKPEAKPERYPPDLDLDEEPDDRVEEDEEDVPVSSDGVDDNEKPFEEDVHKPFDDDDVHKPFDDEDVHKPFDDEDVHEPFDDEDFGGDGDTEPPVIGGGHEFPGEDEDDKPDDEEDDEENNVPVPEHDDDEGFDRPEKRPGLFGEGYIFDTPFFNLGQVRKYFHQLERALEHVFKQTLDEARLLNGTFANTTEEEVDINGKKYIVHKSLIKGADNHSSIYVETLSSKPKEGTNGMEVGKNETNN